MRNEQQNQAFVPAALIYCRVSSTKQRTQGSGLDTQEHRCRQYAATHGLDVEAVFPDDVSGGGDFMKRPGMRALLSYLEAQPGKEYVVIFDDLKRFARDTLFHLILRKELQSRGATVKCLNFSFEDSPEGKFSEIITAASGELERAQIGRQNFQKSKARLEAGYAITRAAYGYKYVPSPNGGGKVLVPDEPLASTVRDALEGYASGRFASQAEIQRFLEADPHFPKVGNGFVRPMTVTRMLKKVVYAGYIESMSHDVSLRKGRHDALISFETFQIIQDKLEGKKRAPAARKDYNVDFPLRGFVSCKCCGNAMTAAWSKGKYRRYAYYRCETRGCDAKSKSVARAKLEAGFEEIIQRLAPSRGLVELAGVMFQDAWALKEQSIREEQAAWKSQMKAIEKDIETTLDKIIDTENKSVIRAFEKRIDKLEKQKIVLMEKASKPLPEAKSKRECMELSLKFLSNPWNIYKNGNHAVKQTVLRLAFAEPLTYCPKEAYGTPKTSFPFKVLGDISRAKKEMVL